MANITTSTASQFVPEIWAQKALEILRNQIVLARRVTMDSEIATFNQGETLHIPYPGTFTTNDKAANGAVTLQTPSGGTSVSLTLNKHKEVSFLVEDHAKAVANQDIMTRYMEGGIIAIAEKIETDLWATYSSFTHSVGTSGTDLTAASVRAARKALNDQKAPQTDRSLVVSSKDEISLLGDSALQNYFAYSRPEAVAEGSLGRAYGFDIFMSQLAPVVAGTPNSTKNLAFSRGAILLGMRALPEPPQGSGAVAAIVRDPVSGLVIRVLMAYNPTYLGVQVTLDVLYGITMLRDEKAAVVLS